MSVAEARAAMLGNLFAAIDRKDTDGFVDHLTTDATFRFGSSPPVIGRDAIRIAVDGFFSTIAGLRHEYGMPVANGNTLFCEGDVTYTRHDDTTITLPFVDVFELEDDLISKYKIYMDIGPLYAQ